MALNIIILYSRQGYNRKVKFKLAIVNALEKEWEIENIKIN